MGGREGGREGGGNEVVEIRKGEVGRTETHFGRLHSQLGSRGSLIYEKAPGIDRNARTLDMTGRDEN